MQFLSHVKMLIEALNKMSLTCYLNKKSVFGAVSPDLMSLLGVERDRSHKEDGIDSRSRYDTNFTIGRLSHLAVDENTHDRLLNGDTFERASQLKFGKLDEIYLIDDRKRMESIHLIIEELMEEAFVYSGRKLKELELLESSVKGCSDSMVYRLCSWHYIGQDESKRIREGIRNMNFDFFSNKESYREFFAFIICNILEGKKKADSPFLKPITQLPQDKLKHILPLFDEAKRIMPDYTGLLEETKESVKERIYDFLNRKI